MPTKKREIPLYILEGLTALQAELEAGNIEFDIEARAFMGRCIDGTRINIGPLNEGTLVFLACSTRDKW